MTLTLEEIRNLKEERGYTIAALSDYSGVPLGTLQKILNGETKNPRKASLDALEKVLLGEEKEYRGKSYYYAQRSHKVHESESGYHVNESNSQNNEFDIARIMNEIQSKGYSQRLHGDYTVEDYISLPDDIRLELIEGVFYDMGAPSNLHQEMQLMIAAQLLNQIREKKGSCKVFTAPTDVRMKKDNKNMVQPDVFIVCDKDKVTYECIEGAVDFALEIISPSTRKKDMTTKLVLYQEAGVREYWMIDPMEKKLIIYDLEKDSMIPKIAPLTGEQGLIIYKDDIRINLDELGEIADEYAMLLEKS